MRSYHLETFGTIDGIQLREQEMPRPGPGEVLVGIKAVSLNRRDLYILHQTYPLPGRPGVIPASDGVGEVIATGDAVTRFKKGDRVCGNYFAHWRDGRIGMDIMDQLGCTLDGMLTEYALLKEDALVHVPGHLSWEEAATLPCSALTAWSALTAVRQVLAGDTILTIGSGGVAVFAIQFARALGARVISLTSKDEKTDRLKAVGANHVINYRRDEQWHKQVLALTDGRGADLVIETGGTDTLEQSVLAAGFGSEIVLLTPQGTIEPGKPVPLNKILSTVFVKNLRIQPVFVGSRLGFEAMNRAIAFHHIKPVIDAVFSFEEARDAYRYMAKGEQFGKVVVRL
ncbi:MAG TPA: NAD(P)-dependent alcohol dehydrogenase [Chitinophagaceae bacterium]|nr:NAD(P)-dependent alcohol dehydrogenase [Chitinophagaceae bacterium]